MMIPCVAACSVLTFSWIGGSTTTAGLIVYAGIFGFFFGSFLSLPPVAVVSITPNLGLIGTRMGRSVFVAATGLTSLLVGTPVSGAIVVDIHHFLGLQVFWGVILQASSRCVMRYSVQVLQCRCSPLRNSIVSNMLETLRNTAFYRGATEYSTEQVMGSLAGSIAM